jgi:hypothetical protein
MRHLAAGGNTGQAFETVPYNVRDIYNLKEFKLNEADIGLSSTTPVLGQYAPTFGWPDDWGYMWEYVDARLFVPEAAKAVQIKTRLIWKPGWEIDCSSQAVIDEIKSNWKKQNLTLQLKETTANALLWGTGYAVTVDNSKATWASGYDEYDYALGQTGIIYGLPRPLLKWQPASKFYGLKVLDSRTMRQQIHPQRFDIDAGDVFLEKVIQRRWAGPLAPTGDFPQSENVEIDIHPDQIFMLKFNKIGGGIYGYSQFREVLFVMKGYLLMNQFLPQIVHRRADPLLHFKFGANVKLEGQQEITNLPTSDQVESEAAKYATRIPGQDIYSNMLLQVEEVYKGRVSNVDIIEYLRLYKERMLFGLGIPMSTAVLSAAGSEIKWGALNYEILEDDVTELQETESREINRKLIPRLHPKTAGIEAEFRFNPIHPEDWRADANVLFPWVQNNLITIEYALERMQMPPAEARAKNGTYLKDIMPQLMMQPFNKGGNGGNGKPSANDKQDGEDQADQKTDKADKKDRPAK